MIRLQERGCHNINLVTATHFLPWVVRSLRLAAEKGLVIPIVYNCGGYEHASTLGLLDGIVDIYLPDMKYGSNGSAQLFSRTANYRSFNRSSVREMFRQVGPLRTTDDGIAWRGLCIRHLILPNNLASSDSLIEFLLTVFDPADIHISLMAQYRPLYRAAEFAELNRMITPAEYDSVKNKMVDAGFGGYFQDLSTINGAFIIDFTKRKEEALTGDEPVSS
jgi:putative pyruvate formate lyase activating enzyme